jgi:RimJ/RimL family protein N-acetyltransferase
MGVDLKKIPTRTSLTSMLKDQIKTDIEEKKSYALIWELDGLPVGHSNVNEIEFGHQAIMHLHLWQSSYRKRGIGTEFVKKSLPYYFENLQLEKLLCQPYALNLAPNRTLEKAGFTFVKKIKTIPGYLNFEQEVNIWKLSRKQFLEIREF